ncbi:MAG: redoxin domain-containing protein [Gammaproteobacteria bacterium]|nr:redoxin domain-containing protein [Gammaproteobacteria bacterium]
MQHKQNRSNGYLAALLLALSAFMLPANAARNMPRIAPEFTHAEAEAWLNAAPLSLRSLRGRVVLVDFWTFDCWNCYRSFPWLHSLERRHAEAPFAVIGVHTPEFEHERQKSRLLEKIEEYRLTHPIMIDNDFSYWNAVGSRYWPSFYLIDKQGMIRATFFGQTDVGSAQAHKIDAMIDTLLAE